MNKTKSLKTALIIVCSLAASAVCIVVIAIVLNKNDKDFGAPEEDTQKIQAFSNQGSTYTLKLDSYVTFSDSTSCSSVNNEDGLEVNYSDNVTI